MSEGKWKQFQNSQYINWIIAKSRNERKYFWIRFMTISIIIIILAHFPNIGWSLERYIAIPEENAWDLNPIFWPPYYFAGNTYVRNNMYKGYWDPLIPPFQFMSLYILSLIYWLFIAFLISKTFTWNKFKNKRLLDKKSDTAV